jgi:regulator of protease activity HflC (stomatin/prohibitin superfamily)
MDRVVNMGGDRNFSMIGRSLGFIFALVVIFLLMSASCTRIGPGHVGVKVSLAGTSRGVEDIPATTGWVFYNPLLTRVYEYPTFVQTAKWTRDLNEGRPINEEITFTNKDNMLIAADISLSYSLQPDKVPHFYVKFRSDDLSSFTHGFLRNVARDCFNEHAGKFAVEQIMGDNAPFLKEVRECLQSQMTPIGIQIEQFGFIGAPRPPEAIVSAINAKAQAQQIAMQKQNEIVQAQAEAAKQVARAEGEAKAQIARAQGEAEANRLLSQSINQTLIEWRRLEIQARTVDKWNGVRPTVEGGGAGLMLQIPKP